MHPSPPGRRRSSGARCARLFLAPKKDRRAAGRRPAARRPGSTGGNCPKRTFSNIQEEVRASCRRPNRRRLHEHGRRQSGGRSASTDVSLGCKSLPSSQSVCQNVFTSLKPQWTGHFQPSIVSGTLADGAGGAADHTRTVAAQRPATRQRSNTTASTMTAPVNKRLTGSLAPI